MRDIGAAQDLVLHRHDRVLALPQPPTSAVRGWPHWKYESHKRRSSLTQVSDTGPFPDDVPLADALEQQRPAAEAADLETVDLDERVPTENGDTPLESNTPDWQEQHEVVETHDEDEVREE